MQATLDLSALTLDRGDHVDPEDGLCAMEAVAMLAGEDHTDHPTCASPVIAAFLRNWNDHLSTVDRQALKRHLPAVIGTNTGPADDEVRAWMACDWLVRTCAPAWLRLAGLFDLADGLAGLPEVNADTAPVSRPLIRAAGAKAGTARRAVDAGLTTDNIWDAAAAACRSGAVGGINRTLEAIALGASDVAWEAAGAAAGIACAAGHLDPPVAVGLQDSAHVLVERMCQVGR